MISELRNKLNQVEESRKNLNYALDMLEEGVGFKSYSNLEKEIDLVIEFNNRLANYVLGLVDTQEDLDVTLETIIKTELEKEILIEA